jgi:hypothetical protein
MEKARKEATAIWEQKGYTEDTLENIVTGTHE